MAVNRNRRWCLTRPIFKLPRTSENGGEEMSNNTKGCTNRSMRTRQHRRAAGSMADRSRAAKSASGHANACADPKRNYERFCALARRAALAGDTIETENFYQHAEHYFRLMREQAV